MGKFVGSILQTVVGTALLFVPGMQAVGISLIASGVISAVSTLLTPSIKSEAGETQKKEPMPVRSRGIGTRRVYGKSMLFDTAEGMTLPFGGSTGGVSVDVLAFLDQRCHAVGQVYLNDDKVTLVSGVVQELDDERYTTGKVKAGFNLGLPTETAFADVINAMPGIWTADHRGDGVTSGYLLKAPVKDKNFLKCYPQGDNVILSAVFDMAYLFDPRDESMDAYDPDTWVVASPNLDNPALGLLWYLLTDRGVDYDTKILPVIDYWIAAADHCDELVATKSGTEKRYRCCILYDLNVEPANVIQEILKTFDGWLSQDELGRWVVYSGQYYAPTVTIGPEHILDARHQGFVEEEDFYNNINVSYISAEHDYAQVPADPWRDDADIAARGRENSTDFNPQVPSHSQARRLTKRQAQRQNANDRGTLTLDYGGRVALGQRYIWLNHVEAGTTFYTGPAEIVTSPERDMQVGSITFDWVAADPDVDDWNPATEEGEPAPVGDRVPLATLSAPVISSAVPQYSDDGVSALIAVEVDAEDREDLTWFGRWKRSSDVVWSEQEYSDIDGSALVELLIGVVPLESVDVAVAYKVGDGRVSPWSATETVDASQVISAPFDLAAVATDTDSVEITYRQPRSLILNYSHVLADETTVIGSAAQVGADQYGAGGAEVTVTEDSIVAGPRSYWAVAFDDDGNDAAIGPVSINVGGFDFSGGSLPAGASLTRSGTGWYFNSSGVLTSAGTDTARFDHRWNGTAWVLAGLLVEPDSENRIRNGAAAGSTAGVMGSGGVAPTNWTFAGTGTGLTREIIGTGTEDGLNYIDVRIHGTATNSGLVDFTFEALTQSAAVVSDQFAASIFAKLTAGSLAGLDSIKIGMIEYNASSTSLATQLGTAITPTATRQRFESGFTVGQATAAYTRMLLRIDTTVSVACDLTLRLYEPQFELGSGATSPIPTSGAKVTRNADALVLDWSTNRHVPDGAMTTRYGFDDASTQDVATTVASGTATVPTTLNRHAILSAQKVS